MLLADREECKFLFVIAESLLSLQVNKFPPGFWTWTMKDKICRKELCGTPLPMKLILLHFMLLF